MLDTPETPSTYRCGDLEIDVGLQRVARSGVDVPLPKLSLDLLLALIGAAPNFVSNRQLMARVWPGLIVADKTVSQRVKLLRDALGDDPDHPRYIVGLRGRGYRIKPDVVRVAAARSATAIGSQAATPLGGEPSAQASEIARAAPAAEDGARGNRRGARALQLAVVLLVGFVAVFGRLGTRSPTPAPDKPVPAAATELRSEHTIAVLPFRATSGAEDDASLALSVPETVLDRLSTVAGLDVIARNSSFKIAEKSLDAGEVGRRLGARYLVDGTVQSTSNRLRVAARLIDSEAGTQIWAESFDREIGDIFAIQDDIAQRITAALQTRIVRIAPSAPRPRPTGNVEAYLAFLRGRALLARWTVPAADSAEREFTRAIEADPQFAAAYASLYDARMMAEQRRAGGGSPSAGQPALRATPLDVARERNRELIDKALALDPESGTARFARAIWANDESAERERDFRLGLERDPSNGRGITAFAEYLDRTGRADEAEKMLARAIEIDPLAPRAYFWSVMRGFPTKGTPELENGLRRVLDIDPDYEPALQRYSKYRWFLHGELAEAIKLIEYAISLDPESPWLTHTAVAMYLDAGDTAAARSLVASAKRPDVAGQLLLDLHDGNVSAAAEAAFDDAAFANGVLESWGVFEALRDGALATHEYDEAIAYVAKRTGLGGSAPISPDNFRAVPAFAQLLVEAQRAEDAKRLLRMTIQWIDDFHVPNLGNVYALRVKAASLLLLGETDLALQTLDASFRANDYLQWWYTFDRDPLWLPLHGDPRFAAIEARVREHVAIEAAALEQLRSQSVVPRRSTAYAASSERQ